MKLIFLSLHEANLASVFIYHLKEMSQNFFFSEVSWLLASVSDSNFDFITECFLLFFILNQLLLFLPENEYHGYNRLITATNDHSILTSLRSACLIVSSSCEGLLHLQLPHLVKNNELDSFFCILTSLLLPVPTPWHLLYKIFCES